MSHRDSFLTLQGHKILASEVAKNIALNTGCQKWFKSLYFADMAMAKTKLFNCLRDDLKLPAKTYLQSIYIAKDRQFCKENALLPGVCPKSGALYFYSAKQDKIIPFSFKKFCKLLNLKPDKVLEVSLKVPLKFNIEEKNGLRNGEINCNDGSWLVFDENPF